MSGYEQLLAALRADGLSVEASGAVEDPFFSGDAFAIAVAGAPVSVYQFTDESAAAAAAATVNPTGTIIGTIIVDWAEPPHFYRQGRLVALYAGENETVLEALASALGQPFVVGEGLFGPLPDTTGSPAPTEPVALAYVNADNALVIRNGAGETVNTIAVADDYVGSPLFGPGGELVFYGAEIQGDPAVSLAPARGTLYRAAPPTAQAEVLAQSPGLRFPRAWFGPERVVVDFAQGVDGWRTALVGLDGELAIMALEAAATFVEVLPASGPVDG